MKKVAPSPKSTALMIQEAIDQENELFILATQGNVSVFGFWDFCLRYTSLLNSNEVTSSILKVLSKEVLGAPRRSIPLESNKGIIVMGLFQLTLFGKMAEVVRSMLSDDEFLKARELFENPSAPDLSIDPTLWNTLHSLLPGQQMQLKEFHEAFSGLLLKTKAEGIIPVFKMFDPESGILRIKGVEIKTKVDSDPYYILQEICSKVPFEYTYFDGFNDGRTTYKPTTSSSFLTHCKRLNDKAQKLGIPKLIDYQQKQKTLMARLDISLK
jgi:hypothetical protein